MGVWQIVGKRPLAPSLSPSRRRGGWTVVILLLLAAASAATAAAGERPRPPPSQKDPPKTTVSRPPKAEELRSAVDSPRSEQMARTNIIGPDAYRIYTSDSPPPSPPKPSTPPLKVIVLPPAPPPRPAFDPGAANPALNGDVSDLVALAPEIPGLMSPEKLASGQVETRWNGVALPPATGNGVALPPATGNGVALPLATGNGVALSPATGNNAVFPPTAAQQWIPSPLASAPPAGDRARDMAAGRDAASKPTATISLPKDWERRAELDILNGVPVTPMSVPATGAQAGDAPGQNDAGAKVDMPRYMRFGASRGQ